MSKELTSVQKFTPTFFHLMKGFHCWIQFYLNFPYLMSFLFCFPLHTYLLFVCFSILFWLPSYMKVSLRDFNKPLPSNDVGVKPCPSVTIHFSSLEPWKLMKTIKKLIYILRSWETITDRQIWTLTCYPLGHQYTFELIYLKD